jgi:hypothetical protein
VTKQGLFLTSFVAAIPGALMAYLMVAAFLQHAGGPSAWTKALAGMLLLIGLLLAAMPLGIFLYGGPKTEKAPAKKAEGDSSEEGADAESAAESGDDMDSRHAETVIGDADEFEERADVTDENLEVFEGAPDEFSVTGEVVTGDSAAEESFDADADSDFEVNTGDDEEPFEFDDEEPKKGKKK